MNFSLMINKWISEFLGTFALVFAGTGAIIVNDLFGGVITHPGIAITFGLIVMAMIYAVGDISGAHLNPARSLAPAVFSGTFTHLWIYLIAPFIGSALAIFVRWITRAVAQILNKRFF